MSSPPARGRPQGHPKGPEAGGDTRRHGAQNQSPWELTMTNRIRMPDRADYAVTVGGGIYTFARWDDRLVISWHPVDIDLDAAVIVLCRINLSNSGTIDVEPQRWALDKLHAGECPWSFVARALREMHDVVDAWTTLYELPRTVIVYPGSTAAMFLLGAEHHSTRSARPAVTTGGPLR